MYFGSMNQNNRILLVDDEPDITEFLEFNFQQEGFDVRIADNGKTAIDIARYFQPHLIVMDIMMPVLDGVEACRLIKKGTGYNDPLICLLSARNEDFSQLAGFDAGADEYLFKPISPRVLIERMKVLLKLRYGSEKVSANGSTGEQITISKEFYSVFKNQEEIQLPRKEFQILSLIASKPNRLFSRDEIFTHIWGSDAIVSDRTMDVYIRKIRSKIGDQFIRTVKGVGYKFIQQ